jgi:hypothetical protein
MSGCFVRVDGRMKQQRTVGMEGGHLDTKRSGFEESLLAGRDYATGRVKKKKEQKTSSARTKKSRENKANKAKERKKD